MYIYIFFIFTSQLLKWSKQLHILTQALAKIFIRIFLSAAPVEKIFFLWLHQIPTYCKISSPCDPEPAGFGVWFFDCFGFYIILSKLPHLFQASWCFSTQQCLVFQSLDHCTSAQNKNKKSRAYSTKDFILQHTEYFDLHRAASICDSHVLKWLWGSILFESQCKANDQAKNKPQRTCLDQVGLFFWTACLSASLGSKDFALKWFSFLWVKQKMIRHFFSGKF